MTRLSRGKNVERNNLYQKHKKCFKNKPLCRRYFYIFHGVRANANCWQQERYNKSAMFQTIYLKVAILIINSWVHYRSSHRPSAPQWQSTSDKESKLWPALRGFYMVAKHYWTQHGSCFSPLYFLSSVKKKKKWHKLKRRPVSERKWGRICYYIAKSVGALGLKTRRSQASTRCRGATCTKRIREIAEPFLKGCCERKSRMRHPAFSLLQRYTPPSWHVWHIRNWGGGWKLYVALFIVFQCSSSWREGKNGCKKGQCMISAPKRCGFLSRCKMLPRKFSRYYISSVKQRLPPVECDTLRPCFCLGEIRRGVCFDINLQGWAGCASCV